MKSLLSAFLFLLIHHTLSAQFAETIRSGRPGQAIGAYSVGKNVFQVQSGLTNNDYSTEDPNINIRDEEWLHATVLRYGLTERLEISTVLGGQFGDEVRNGVNNTQIGLRYNFFGNEGARPAVDLQARLLLPWGMEEIRREKIGTRILLGTGNALTNRLGLTTNLGLTLNQDRPNIYFYALALGYSLTDRLGAFVEIYDNFADFSNLELDFDLGLGYFVTNDLKLDISTGWQDSSSTEIDNWFVDFGISFRIYQQRE